MFDKNNLLAVMSPEAFLNRAVSFIIDMDASGATTAFVYPSPHDSHMALDVDIGGDIKSAIEVIAAYLDEIGFELDLESSGLLVSLIDLAKVQNMPFELHFDGPMDDGDIPDLDVNIFAKGTDIMADVDDEYPSPLMRAEVIIRRKQLTNP